MLRVKPNAIDSEKIRLHAIEATDIDSNSVTSRIIKNGTIQGEDISENAELNVKELNVSGTITGNASTVTNGVYTIGDQNIAGTKTFSSTIVGDITGLASGITGTFDFSKLANPNGNLALTMNSYLTTFTYGNATGAGNLFNITDTASNSGTGILLNITTGNASLINPFRVSASNGVFPAIAVDSTGKVGIGWTVPTSQLTVVGGATFGATYSTALLADGNVAIENSLGIGTTSPGAALEVNGNAIFDGIVTIGTLDNTVALRSDSGNFEYKNASGAWTGIGSGRIVRITNGVVKEYESSADTDVARGVAYLAAYSDAVAGDIIHLGPGAYDIGYFILSKADVSIEGSGMGPVTSSITGTASTILHGAIVIGDPARRVMLSDFVVYNDEAAWTNTFVSGATNITDVSLVMKNIRIIAAVAGDHIFQISGTNILLENVHTFGAGSGYGHGFVIKGANNVVINNSSSYGSGYNGLLIKADLPAGAGMGDVSNVKVNGFKSTSSAADGLFLDAEEGAIISGVDVENYLSVSDALSAVQLGTSAISHTSNLISDVNISVDIVGSAVGLLVQDCAVTNTTVKIRGSVTSDKSVIIQYNNPNISISYDRDIITSWGRDSGKTLLTASQPDVMMTEGTIPVPSFSTGALSAKMRLIYADANYIWSVATAGYEFKETALAAGDPVWIVTGTGVGTHKLIAYGTVTQTDKCGSDTCTGAVIGDYYLKTSNTTSGPATGSLTASDVRPGKVLFSPVRKDANYNDFTALSYLYIQDPLLRSSGNVDELACSGRQYSSGTVVTETYTAKNSGLILPYLHSFVFNNQVYFGAFGGGHTTNDWVPFTFDKGFVTYKIVCDNGAGVVKIVTSLP